MTDDRQHSGIIVVTDQLAPIGVQLRALQAIAARFTAEEVANRLAFLSIHIAPG